MIKKSTEWKKSEDLGILTLKWWAEKEGTAKETEKEWLEVEEKLGRVSFKEAKTKCFKAEVITVLKGIEKTEITGVFSVSSFSCHSGIWPRLE